MPTYASSRPEQWVQGSCSDGKEERAYQSHSESACAVRLHRLNIKVAFSSTVDFRVEDGMRIESATTRLTYAVGKPVFFPLMWDGLT